MSGSADQTAIWRLQCETGELTADSQKAAEALKGLESAILGDQQRLKALKAELKAVANATVKDEAHFTKLKDAAKALEAKIGDNSQAFSKLGGNFGKLGQKVDKPKTGFAQLARELSKVQGPVGSLAGRLAGVTELLGSTNLRLILVGTGIGVMAAAFTFAVHSFYEFATASAEARRSELLMLEATTSLKDGWKTAAADAQYLQDAIDGVSRSSSVSREKIAGYATELAKAELSGMALKNALKATAIVAAAQGETAATAFMKQAAATKAAGGSMQRLAEITDRKLGKIANAHLYDAGVLADKLGDNLAAMFADIKLDGLNQAKKSFVDLFDQGTSAGKAFAQALSPVKQLLVDIGTYMVNGLTLSIIKVSTWILELQQVWYELGTVVLAGSAILKEWIPETLAYAIGGIVDGLTDWKTMTAIAGAALVAAAPAIWAWVAALWAAVPAGFAAGAAGLAALAPALVAAVPFIVLGAAIYGVISAFEAIWDGWDDLTIIWSEMTAWIGKVIDDWESFGGSIIDGFVEGVKAKFTAAVNAVKSIASGVGDAFRKVLGIHSPSREFAKLGLAIPQGVEAGIAKGQSDLDDAIAGMVTPSVNVSPQVSGGVSSTKGSAGSSQTSVGPFNIYVEGGATGKETALSIRDELTQLFATLSIEMGVS